MDIKHLQPTTLTNHHKSNKTQKVSTKMKKNKKKKNFGNFSSHTRMLSQSLWKVADTEVHEVWSGHSERWREGRLLNCSFTF